MLNCIVFVLLVVGSVCAKGSHPLDVSVEVLSPSTSNSSEEGEGLFATPDDLLPWLRLSDRQTEFCVRCLELHHNHSISANRTINGTEKGRVVLVLPHRITSSAPLLCVPYPFQIGRLWFAQHAIRREAFGCYYHFRARIYSDMHELHYGGLQTFARESNPWKIKPMPMSETEQRLLRVSREDVNPLADSIGGFSSLGFRYYRDPVYTLPPLVVQRLSEMELY
ncbi:unnamed protein product [Orchesella dallaii]|uniref:Uncharacterized protein n=1 Tax=Orchesella dallaii TaxID=48710 RepID=A0ABP1RWQ7_9HEXA